MVFPLGLFIFFFAQISNASTIEFPKDFIFGVANAPGQVEDQLQDRWAEWGQAGKVSGWTQTPNPAERLQFWSNPSVEIELAEKLGVSAFRMGLDWTRIMPARDEFDEKAIAQYRQILQLAKSHKMKVMLTLFHHSAPKWVETSGGWHANKNKNSFVVFAKRMIAEFNSDVSWWNTFNEPNVFIINSYVTGQWPPGEKRSPLSMIPFIGSSMNAMDRMSAAHNEIYEWAHKEYPEIKIGIAHNMAHYQGRSWFDRIQAQLADYMMNWRFPARIKSHMDFFGVNYYGAEWMKGSTIDKDPAEEYSEAGRAIDVNGLYDLLKQIHQRYSRLSIIVTENGVADSEDTIRPAYLIEHLAAIQKAIEDKIPVTGYFVWTLTDNLEWSDGYCPKFGFVSVERESMKRTPRPAFTLYHDIISNFKITQQQRDEAWQNVSLHQGQPRPYCRADDGITGLATPVMSVFTNKDWRFKLLAHPEAKTKDDRL